MKNITFKNEDMTITTGRAMDSILPYETTIQHYQYNDNKTISVGAYDTRLEAIQEHLIWIERMQRHTPDYLMDCCNRKSMQILADTNGYDTLKFYRQK